ncbi:NAD-dependent epimerase/dehydratase family protein [Methylomonas sp. LW13]|uniref:NAD-dependent epimerase/dehydratase family protein n=1 Tax=Methylomonas defluvii TaxID=3045149 RepID=A0ABU4UCI1_9GAMM|nr:MULTISPECIES: NAD-dependent epimerase/dehydratase family protein [unclassified Methylomonas]MDX8127131.1 NAD-dependent epimerase/dehydratase family protein [Methylomonas sp. OY6]QBC25674.1 NAD-dependent epimerase/dehydratase family protein [Methylomonas sp. LW13]
MTKALVTGASGFIGAHLCQALVNQDYTVRTCGRAGNGENNIALDLAALGACPPELCADIDVVFHLAGKAHALAESRQDEAEYRQINTEGTRKLLEAAQQAGVKAFVFFSSVKAVSHTSRQVMDETVNAPASDPYGLSKYEAEQLVLNGGYVPHPVVLRPSMVYGDTGKGNLPRMIHAIRRGIFPPLPESGNQRSMVHVDDVVASALLAAENPEAAGQVYIVTDQQSYSTRQIYDAIRAALGKRPVVWSIPMPLLTSLAKLGDGFGRLTGRRFPIDSDSLEKLTGSAWYSSAKIARELGFQPRQTLWKALPDIIRHLS